MPGPVRLPEKFVQNASKMRRNENGPGGLLPAGPGWDRDRAYRFAVLSRNGRLVADVETTVMSPRALMV